MVQTRPGELLVGAYHRVITGCELVSYNQRSMELGQQTELDVLGVNSEDSSQTVYACEVITHLDGALYSGTPSSNRWSEYGGESYQYSLERIWEKFGRDYEYLLDVFEDADEHLFQLWSPYVSQGKLTNGLDELVYEFEQKYGREIELVINEEYRKRIQELQQFARESTKDYGETGLRFVQILESLR